MKKLTFVSVFMAMIILLVVLTGCSNEEKTSEIEGNPPKEEENQEPKEATYDLEGRTIRIANHWDMTPEEGSFLGDISVERWREVEEKYNVTIEWIVVPYEEKVSQLTSTIIAGEPFADIVGLDSKFVPPLVQNNYLQAIDDLLDINSTQLNQTLIDMGTFNDKVYLFQNEVNQSGGMYYNKTMFEEAGLPDPYVLQEAGEWTWEAMLDAAKKLTDGTTFGLSGDPNLFAEYFIATNGAQILNTDTGEVTIDSAAAVEAYEFMASLYNEHRVVKANEGNNWEDPRNYFTEGLVGMTQGWVWEAGGRADTSFDWGYVLWPKGPKATDYVTPVSDVGGMVIPVGVEDADVVFKIWQDMQLWEYAEDNVLDWIENVMPNVESVATAEKMLEHIEVNFWQAFNIDETFNELNEAVATGEESPSQALTRVKGELQSQVNDFTGQN